jgi:hypothetical protein
MVQQNRNPFVTQKMYLTRIKIVGASRNRKKENVIISVSVNMVQQNGNPFVTQNMYLTRIKIVGASIKKWGKGKSNY